MIPPSALAAGSRIEDYEIERLISSDGSFGLVYLAFDHRAPRVEARRRQLEHRLGGWRRAESPLGYAAKVRAGPSPGPRVVIKEFFPAELAERDSGRRTVSPRAGQGDLYQWSRTRFLDEARFLQGHEHPNVVAVFDVLSANNTEYMVMEQLDGGSLEALVQGRGRQTEAEVRRWLRPVLRALQSTEARDVDHLDLSPQNVMFRRPGGDPVLIDFGAARMSTASRTRGSRLIVNDGYSAPEKYQSTSQGLDARADVYALGALVVFALTGRRPPGPAEGAAAAFGPAPAGAASAPFLKVIALCLEPEPGRRAADARGLERALEPWDPAAPVSTQGRQNVAPAPALSGPDLRRRAQLAFLALLGLLFVLLLIGPALALAGPADLLGGDLG